MEVAASCAGLAAAEERRDPPEKPLWMNEIMHHLRNPCMRISLQIPKTMVSPSNWCPFSPFPFMVGRGTNRIDGLKKRGTNLF